MIKARGLCGEEDYDSDNSVLGDELDDSGEILKRLTAKSGPEPVVLPSVEDAETGQALLQPGAQRSPKKSPYFGVPSCTKSTNKKRRASMVTQQQSKEDTATLVDDSKAARRASKKARRKSQRAELRLQSNTQKSHKIERETSTHVKSKRGENQQEDFQVPVIQ